MGSCLMRKQVSYLNDFTRSAQAEKVMYHCYSMMDVILMRGYHG